MIHYFKRILLLVIILIGIIFETPVFADGSKDLYPAAATGKRAYLVSSSGGLATASWPFQSRGTIKVFVKNNEYIYAGSSAQGIGSGTINIFAPSVTPNASRTNFTFSSGAGTTTGRIANRAQELAGPSPTAGGYTPYVVQNTTGADGIFEIDFISPNPTQGSTPSVPDMTGNFSWTATNTAHQPSSQPLILAWDVSVRAGGLAETDLATYPFINGRAYTNVFNGHITGDFNSGTGGFYGKFFVLTKDGFAYRVSGNGQVGVGFTFFVNNRGYTTGANGAGNSTYKSLNSSAAPSIKDPREVDDLNITHKIFFTKPANDLPATTINNGATTWLKEASPQIPTVTNISFVGVEGSADYMSSKGAYIKFDSNLAGTFKITIPGNGSFNDRVLTGTSVPGANQIKWDGKAGLSVADPISAGAAIPPGVVLNTIKVQLFGAEVHFPFIDVEINPKGIIIEQLTTDGNYDIVTGKDVVYWDDSDITLAGNSASSTPSSPTKPAFGISGVSSNANGHKFGKHDDNGGAGGSDWGNNRAIDTYSFVEGSEVTKTIAATISQADLEVTSITPSVTTQTVGNTITYTVVIKNLNIPGVSISDVTGATFGLEYPAGFTVNSAVLTVNNGTIVESSPNTTATKFSSTLSMTSGSQATYVITGTVGAALKSTTLIPRATILRPADITDPNATDESTPAFSGNADTECNGAPSGAGCNNILSPTGVTIPNTPPVANPNVNNTNMNTVLTVADGAAGDILLDDTDSDGDVLTVTGFLIGGVNQSLGTAHVLAGGEGSITIYANGSYTFVPAPGFVGTTGPINYSITDGIASASSTLTITVSATNAAPVAVANTNTVAEDATLTVADGAAGVTGDLLVNDTDADNDVLTVASYTIAGIAGTQTVGNPVTITDVGSITINANGSYTFVPVANYNGPVPVITYTATDGTATATSTLTITVTPVNDPPVVADIAKSGAEDVNITFTVADFTSKYADPVEGSAMTQIVVASLPQNGTLKLNGNDISAGQVIPLAQLGDITFVPAANWNGSTSFNWNGYDGDLYGVANAAVNITVTPVNDAPVAVANTNTVAEDVTLNVIDGAAGVNGDILVNDTDVDGNTLTVASYTIAGIAGIQTVGSPVAITGVGSVTINADGSYTFVPVADYNGTVPVITYTATDGTATATSTLTITVTSVNDVPSFTKGADQTAPINAAAQTVNNWATGLDKGPADENGQVLDFIVTNDKNALFTVQPAIDVNGNLTYTPAPGQYGKATVTVQVHDNGGVANGGADTSPAQTFVINIKPVGVTDTDLTPFNTPVTTNVTANDGTSGTGTTVVTGTQPAHGTITVNPDRSITYTPNPGYVGQDTYTYILKTPDGVESDPVTVNINVYNPKISLAKEGTYIDFNANGRVDAGDRINYTFAVTNTGTIPVTNITIADPAATIAGGPIASLASGATDNLTFTGFHTLTQAEIDNSGVFNLATATGKDPKNNNVSTTSIDPTPLDPADPNYPVTPPTPLCPSCTITPIVQTGSITLAKEGVYSDFNADGKVSVGDRINYTFVVTNTGNVTLTNIAVTDPGATIHGGPIASLAVGASDNSTFTGFHTLTQIEIDNGGVFNTAAVTAKDPKGKDISSTSIDPTPLDPADPAYPVTPPTPACPSCTVTPIVQTGSMTLAKEGVYNDTNGDGKVNLGDRILYTFVVTNTGNTTLSNVVVTDPAAVIAGGPIASLMVGASDHTTFTGYHLLTQADIDNSGVYNLAAARAKDPRGKDITTTSNDPTPLDPSDPNYPVTPPTPPCPGCTITPIVQTGSMTLAKEGVYNDANGDGKVNAGDRILYTFTVKNTGNVTLTNVNVTDANAIITGGPIATLAAGSTDHTTFTGYHILTIADLDNGGVFNTATAAGKDPKGKDITTISNDPTPLDPADPNYPVTQPTPPCPTCTVTPIVQKGSMTLAKEGVYNDTNGDGKVNVGDRINYTFMVVNTGNVTLSNIMVTDPGAVITGGPLLTLAAGASNNSTFTAYHSLTQADIDNGGVFNTATATGKDTRGKDITTISTDPTPLDPTDPDYPAIPPTPACPTCTVTPIPQNRSMSLAKEGTYVDTNADGKVNVGDRINYAFTVTNTGNVTLSNIMITDASAVVSGGPITTLAVGASNSTTFTAYHILTQADIDNGGVFNIAIAKGKDPGNKDVTTTSNDPTPLDPADPNYPVTSPTPACPGCTVTPVVQAGSMTLLKDGVYNDANGDGKVNVGDRINYTFRVSNTGNVTLTNITLADANATISGGPLTSLAAGATDHTTFTGYHVLTQADIDNRGVFNTAVVTGKDPRNKTITVNSTDPTPVAPGSPGYPIHPPVPACPDCTVTPIVQTGSIALVKSVTNTGNGTGGSFVLGDVIQYTFTITNTGNVTLSNITLSDAKLGAGTIAVPGTLLPNAVATIVKTYVVTASDIAAGNVTNTAVADAKDPANNPVTDVSGTTPANNTPTITVLAKPAVANNDAANTRQNDPVIVTVVANDVPGSVPIVPATVLITVQPTHGMVSVNPDGTVTYTPNPGYVGADTFTYTVEDANGQTSNPAVVNLTILPSNPKAATDAAKTTFSSPVTIPVLANDVKDGADFDPASIEIVGQPQHGTIKFNADGTLTYTPKDGYTGTETFTYRVKDKYGNWTNAAAVTVLVEGTFVPNVITPDGDGKNDFFIIVGLQNYDGVEVEVYNRWGNQVYANKNYNNDWSGERLNEGTYYYNIRFRKGSVITVQKGWVLIKR